MGFGVWGVGSKIEGYDFKVEGVGFRMCRAGEHGGRITCDAATR